MSFFIHFKSEFDALLEVNTLSLGELKASDSSFVSLEVTENYPLFVKVLPLMKDTSGKTLLPYAFKLNIHNGYVLEEPSQVVLTHYPNNEYEVLLLKQSTPLHTLPNVIEQQTYVIKNSSHTATLFYDGIYQFSIQEKDLLFTYEIKAPVESARIEKLKNKDVVLLEVALKNKEIYVMLLHFKNGAYKLITEGIFEKIEKSDQLITLLKKQNDMAGHAFVIEYELKPDAVVKKEEYVVYMNDKAKTVSLKELIPFAFLEAVKVKNYALSRSYLTDELSASLMDEHMDAYFGDFLEALPAVYEKNPANKIAIISKHKKREAKVFEVVFEKNKISNFSES